MADFSSLFTKETHLSPYHIDDLATAYGSDNYTGASQATEIAAALTEINNRFDGFLAAHPEFDAGMIAEVEGLRDYCIAAVNDNIPTEATVPFADIFTQVRTDFTTDILDPAKGNRAYVCKRCTVGGSLVGRYELSQDTGDVLDTKEIECVTCDGWGAGTDNTIVTPTLDWKPDNTEYTT